MSLDQNISMSMDVDDVIKGSKAIADALHNVGLSIKDVTSVSRDFSKTGKVVEAALSGIDDAGNKVRITLKETKKGIEVMSASLTKGKEAIRDYKAEADKLLRKEFTTAPNAYPGATSREQLDFVTAKAKLRNYIASENLIGPELSGMFGNMSKGMVGVYSERVMLAQKMYAQVREAEANLGAATRRELEKTKAVADALTKSRVSQHLTDLTTQEREAKRIQANADSDLRARVAQRLKDIAAQEREARRQEKANATVEDKPYLSLNRISRYAETYALYQGINLVTGALREGLTAAIQYENTIARIQTLSQESGNSFRTWSNSITALSNKYGTDAVDTAKAYYDALSNQIGSAGSNAKDMLPEIERFTESAIKLAQVTNATVPQAGNILASAMNAFHLSASRAEEISAKFFKAVDLGRIQLGDLANSLGRVAVPAQLLGVTLEEVLAMESALTKQGVSVADAQTQVSNVMSKLLKPSEELSKWLRSIGYESGIQAVHVETFTNVVTKLNDELKKNGAGPIAKEFNDVRGFRGVIGILGDNYKDYIDYLAKMNDANQSYQNAVKLVFENKGKIVEKELNKIKTYFLGYGQDVIASAASTGHLADAVQIAAQSLVVLGTAFSVAKISSYIQAMSSATTATGALTGAVRALGAALLRNPITAIFTVAAGAAAYWALNYESSTTRIQRISKEFVDNNKESTDAFINNNNKALDAYTDQQEKYSREQQKILVGERKVIWDRITEIENANKALKGALELGYSHALKIGHDYVHDAEHQLTEIQSASKKVEEKIRKAQEAYILAQSDDALEDMSRGKRIKGLQKLLSASIAELNKAKTAEQVSNALDTSIGYEKRLQAELKDQSRDDKSTLKALENAQEAQRKYHGRDHKSKQDAVDAALEKRNEFLADKTIIDSKKEHLRFEEAALKAQQRIKEDLAKQEIKAQEEILRRKIQEYALDVAINRLKQLDTSKLGEGETAGGRLAERGALLDQVKSLIAPMIPKGSETLADMYLKPLEMSKDYLAKKLALEEQANKKSELMKYISEQTKAKIAYATELTNSQNSLKLSATTTEGRLRAQLSEIAKTANGPIGKMSGRNFLEAASSLTDLPAIITTLKQGLLQYSNDAPLFKSALDSAQQLLKDRTVMEQNTIELNKLNATTANTTSLDAARAEFEKSTAAIKANTEAILKLGDPGYLNKMAPALGPRDPSSDAFVVPSPTGGLQNLTAPDPGNTISVGDINVSLNGTGNTSNDAMEIAATIKREITRGTFRWERA